MKCKTCNHILKTATCPTCNEKKCMYCIYIFVLESIHPLHCSSCRHEWYDLMSIFSSSMMLKYKTRCSELLFLKDQSYFAPYQPEIKRLQSQKKISQRIKEVVSNININNKDEEQLVSQQRKKERELKENLNDLVSVFKKNESKKINRYVVPVRSCVNQDCRGIIIQSKDGGYLCELCNLSVCLHCKTNHDTFFFCSVDKKNCPSCSYTVYQTGTDEAVCFACHHVFSWSKPTYSLSIKNNLQVSTIPINYKVDNQVRPYFLLVRHLRRFSYPAYDEYLHPSVDKIYVDRLSYLSGEMSLDVYKDKLYKLNQKLFRLRHERELLVDYIHKSEAIFTKPILLQQDVDELRQVTQQLQTKINEMEGKGILHSSSFVVCTEPL